MGATQSAVDKISGSKTDNERIWAVASGIAGGIASDGDPIATISASRTGTEAGREAHRLERDFNKAKTKY